MKAYFLLILASALLGCAHAPIPSPEAFWTRASSYNDRFDAWRASNASLDPAAHGDRDAQDVFFLAAYVRVSQPYLGGEDLDQVFGNFEKLRTELGDDAFDTALGRQRPEVRSAANEFFDRHLDWAEYPKSRRLLRSAPKIDWPLDKVNRRNSR